MWKKILIWGALGLIGLFVLIQLVPYGRNHTNPPVVQEPQWNSPQTRELVKGTCFDCHSNETVWPWYSNIAPISWLVYRHTEEGRSNLNFSEWNRPQEGDEIVEVVQEGEMPLAQYRLMHRSAQLDAAKMSALVQGLQATFGGGEGGEGGEESD